MMKRNAPILLVSTVLAGAALGVLIGRARVARRLRQDVARLFAQVRDVGSTVYDEARLVGLPAPVQRYFRHVLRSGQPGLRGLRLRHSGQFKTDLKKGWVDITGQQYITSDPPGFIWQGTTSQFTARDEYVAGRGRLQVWLLGAFRILDGMGPAFDQGELLRWLGESTWLPTNLLPGERTRWQALDDHSAQLTLTYQHEQVAYLVRFNERDEIEQLETQRYQNGTLLPWVGRAAGYREWHSVRVPTEIEASWVMDGQRQPYARFTVLELDYNPLAPY